MLLQSAMQLKNSLHYVHVWNSKVAGKEDIQICSESSGWAAGHYHRFAFKALCSHRSKYK